MRLNRACPECKKKGHDSKDDHLYRMVIKGTSKFSDDWYCRKCHYMCDDDDQPISKDSKKPIELEEKPEAVKETPEFISELSSVADRGISVGTREKYGTKTMVSPSTGLPIKHFYPITVAGKTKAYKVRVIDGKRFSRTEGVTRDTSIELFGMPSLKGVPKRVLITEGEEDAMAAYEMLSKYRVGCLSLPDGTGSIGAISSNLSFLTKVKELYFCPDADGPGSELVEKVVALLPKVKIVELPASHKDPNAMLVAGLAEDFKSLFFESEKWRPPALVRVEDIIDDACEDPTWGRPYPWPKLTSLTYGMRDGEGMFVGAGVKVGKSEFINELVLSRITADDGDIPAVIKFEEQPAMTLRKMAGKMDGTFYHKPDVEFDRDTRRKTMEELKGKMFMYKSFSTADWDTVKAYIRYAVSEGSKTVIIDPITKLTNHLSSSDTETELRRISDELACMAQDLGFFYIVTCHLKSPKDGTPHERGGDVQSHQFRGSRAMMENCFYMLGIQRNKDPELPPAERNVSTFVLLEDRMFGSVGKFKVEYDPDTGSYTEKVRTSK